MRRTFLEKGVCTLGALTGLGSRQDTGFGGDVVEESGALHGGNHQIGTLHGIVALELIEKLDASEMNALNEVGLATGPEADGLLRAFALCAVALINAKFDTLNDAWRLAHLPGRCLLLLLLLLDFANFVLHSVKSPH